MTVDAQDKMKRALARLSGIRKNIDEKDYHVDESLVKEYSSALQHLEELGVDVQEFKIPTEWLQPRIMSTGPNGPKYAKERAVQRFLFMAKLDAVLGYFTMTSSKEKIGFAKTG
jgi:hypothetical protein